MWKFSLKTLEEKSYNFPLVEKKPSIKQHYYGANQQHYYGINDKFER